jgi:glycosyltransferase involved in cell wall biosynthesis
LLAAVDILVCPSRHEPLGNVVLEAWAHRVPVVATASEGPRGLIKPGETGLLVPVEDADALAHAVAQLIGDTISRTALVDAGHAAYSADFSEPAVISAYSAFIQRVAV